MSRTNVKLIQAVCKYQATKVMTDTAVLIPMQRVLYPIHCPTDQWS